MNHSNSAQVLEFWKIRMQIKANPNEPFAQLAERAINIAKAEKALVRFATKFGTFSATPKNNLHDIRKQLIQSSHRPRNILNAKEINIIADDLKKQAARKEQVYLKFLDDAVYYKHGEYVIHDDGGEILTMDTPILVDRDGTRYDKLNIMLGYGVLRTLSESGMNLTPMEVVNQAELVYKTYMKARSDAMQMQTKIFEALMSVARNY